MAIKAITFDFWSTLYTNRPIDYSKRLQQLREALEHSSGTDLAGEAFEGAVRSTWRTWDQVWEQQQRTMSASEWLLTLAGSLSISIPADDLARIKTGMEDSALNHRPILVADVREALAMLAARYRLAIISDTGITPGRVLRQILDDDDLLPYFSHFTFSDELGYSKPHPAAFLSTLSALGAEPGEAVHVGDLLRTDIAGARGVGMRAVQYVGINHDQGPAGLGALPTPDSIIKSHLELEPLLRSWNGQG